jgi:hypothetical protein
MHKLPYEIDCKECGCPDVEVEHEPTPGEWFASGRAKCNECGFVFSFRAPEEAEQLADAFDAIRQVEQSGRAVSYQPIRCPTCKSTDVPVQHTMGRVRYHKCRPCEAAGRAPNFKSVEK